MKLVEAIVFNLRGLWLKH